MPERPLTIATYAAGASLAAITLVYVFGPTFFLDDEAANSSKSSRKKGVVGLVNPANDCFINSILQALAGLPELRLYLIREMHRRKLDGPSPYTDLTAALEEQQKRPQSTKQVPEWKLLGLQQGLVTAGLKDVLDALNERPIYKKTISAQAFIRVVEQAFRTRISRTQQDAQEFLQVIAEGLADECYAGRRARRSKKRRRGVDGLQDGAGVEGAVDESDTTAEVEQTMEDTSSKGPRDSKVPPLDDAREKVDSGVEITPPSEHDASNEDEDETSTFPLEGKLESQVECSHCHFKPRPHISSFVTLTLHVPQNGPTSLNTCFDGMLKQEQIDDFTCDRCRLEHALQVNAKALSKPNLPDEERAALTSDKTKLEDALHEDPEKPPKDVKLPSLTTAPKRRISRHTRISSFPRVLAIHLSRSIYSDSSSSKNTTKVAFPETLPLGGLLDRKNYRLLGVVTHKGGHNSGHYESFRRQVLSPPYSTPASMGTEGIYSRRGTPTGSVAPSPRVSGSNLRGEGTGTMGTESQHSSPSSLPLISTPSLDSRPSSSSLSSPSTSGTGTGTLDRRKVPPPTSVPLDAIPTPGLPTPPQGLPLQSQSDVSSGLRRTASLSGAVNRVKQTTARRKGPGPERWWRISDDKVKESKTSDVLGMQREVYLLFYEVVDD